MYHSFQRYRSVILILSVAIALFILIPAQKREPGDAVPLPESADASIAAGSTAYLSDGGRAIGVGADLETSSALAEAVLAQDRRTYEHLFQNGHAFLVDDRVRVRILSFQGSTAEVQFLEGYHSEQSGFVSRDWLKSER